ncbi:pimeloyl-ACP methyl ester carboxylesterase [Nakamurella flavida]|nr:pimeloyl-ACP methyl ester carboxylesterase [Nakamurella flavida]
MTPVPPSSVREAGPWTHRDVSANGIRFHLAEAGSGPLVLLVHGFAQYWWSWRHQLAGLAERGFRAVAVDLRGYGDTDKTPRGYDARNLAADLAGLVRALGERDAVIVGQGQGGVTAFDTAVLSSAQVRAVVAISAPHPASVARVAWPLATDRYRRLLSWSALPVWPERHLQAGHGALVERLMRSQAGPAWRASADFTETAARMRRAIQIPGAARGAVEHLRWVARSPVRADGFRHREALTTPIRVPVLHVTGDGDRFVPASALVEARQWCLGPYRMTRVPAVGHFPAEEAPDLLTELIAQVAADTDRGRHEIGTRRARPPQAAVQAPVPAAVSSTSPAATTGATSAAVSANPTSGSATDAPNTTPSTVPSGSSSGPPEFPGRTDPRTV